MDAVQAMTGSGGWPMSVFLTPEGKPFYAGTYFPDQPRHGIPSFRQVLAGISDAWSSRRAEVEVQASRVTEAIARASALEGSSDSLTVEIPRAAFTRLQRVFDPRWGGFGGAPKFPQPMTLEFLLRQTVRGVQDALEMVVLTLERMADGGLHDQIGGGFARYSTDEAWLVPHFEKMLYDNAQLALLYARAWLVTRNDRFGEVATRTLDYLAREMRHPDGGFFSSQDADSEGIEGKFYTWSWSELVELVGEETAAAFGATPLGNWDGTNVLTAPTSDAMVGDARAKLFRARQKRVHPALDDKVLTAWNALAIRAFAEAGRIFNDPALVEVASGCASFIWDNLRDPEGRLLRSWRAGHTSVAAFSDDHALLAGGLMTLYEATSDLKWFVAARELCDRLIELFHDSARGGFFQVGSDREQLVVRAKDVYDNALPSGNSAAAEALLRMSLFTGEASYERAGVSGLRLVRDALPSAPSGFGHALSALDLHLGPSIEVAIIGNREESSTQAMIERVDRVRWRPNTVLAVASLDDHESPKSVPLLADRGQIGGSTTGYVCRGFACHLPATDPESLSEQLDLTDGS
jgi:uncharacterized protein YyaL (SSP411 family)